MKRSGAEVLLDEFLDRHGTLTAVCVLAFFPKCESCASLARLDRGMPTLFGDVKLPALCRPTSKEYKIHKKEEQAVFGVLIDNGMCVQWECQIDFKCIGSTDKKFEHKETPKKTCKAILTLFTLWQAANNAANRIFIPPLIFSIH